MIRITLELVPFGTEPLKRTIAIAEIWRSKGNPDKTRNYKYKIGQISKSTKLDRQLTPDTNTKMWKTGELKGFRSRNFSAWYLVARVLHQAITPERWSKCVKAEPPPPLTDR